MATNTYIALDKVTVSGSSTTSVQFTIPSGYTDIKVVINGGSDVATAFPYCYINNDTNANYSGTAAIGFGSSTGTSERQTSYTKCGNFSVAFTTTLSGLYEIDFLDSADNDKYKTALWKMGCVDNTSGYAGVGMATTLWQSNSAITSLDWRLTLGGTDRVWRAGTTFDIFGILAGNDGATLKATGGTITEDATYYYHKFAGSTTFTPLQSLTADILMVAGGGSAMGQGAGGGGAGGLRTFSSVSMTATPYTVLVGAGGAVISGSSVFGNNGTNTTLTGGAISYSTTGGGGGAGRNTGGVADARSGGSGGGGGNGRTNSGGAGNAGGYSPVEGYAGGNASGDSPPYNGGGGGGAGGVGSNNGASGGTGNGGIGATSALINAIGSATASGELSGGNYYFAGGGGAYGDSGNSTGGLGGGGDRFYNGDPNTGGGAGGGGYSGGSGIVVIRYAKA